MKKTLLQLIFILCLFLAGCSGQGERSMRSNELLSVGEAICDWQEAQIYILAQYSKYTPAYGRGLWAVEMEEGTFESYIREGLLDYLKLLFLADYGFEKASLTLTSAEQSAVNRAAEAYMEALGEEGAAKTGITREVAEKAFARFARAQIFYRQTMIDGQVEVSEEEARVAQIQIVEIEQRVGFDQVRQIQQSLEAGKTVNELIRGQEGISSRKESITRGMLPQELETIAFSLKEGQWSPVITLDTKYYIIQSISPYVPEDTAIHKAEMEQSAREENLNKVLKELADSVEMIYNPSLWNGWSMEKYGDYPAVNFYDYCGELMK